MAAVNDVPQLVDKKGADGDAKPESQWTPDERRVVVQDQRLKSIIMSCLPHDIMESVISCVLAKETWTDLVHSFEGPLDTKENRIMDLKLEYQTFRAKSTKSLSQTYTHYKTLLNELANDGVNLSKNEINIGFVNSLPEKWLTFSQGLRNANHTQTLDLADIYRSTAISTAFFSSNVIHDFQENSDDEVDERSSEEYLRDLDTEYQEIALLENSKRFIKRRNNFSVAKTFNWDKEEVNQVKVLMALADDELTVRKSHARNGEWVDITIRKKKVLGGELFTESSSKMNENLFVPASMRYDQEMVPKTKDWVERLNPDSKLPNFNTGRILVPESQAINESLKSTKTLNTPESSKDSEAKSLTPLPSLKIFRELYQAQREDHRTSDHEMYTASLKRNLEIIETNLSVESVEAMITLPLDTIVTVHSTTNHNEFDHFKRDEKIQAAKNFSSPYTTEQNGVAKRKNRTLIEATRTMLNGLVLSKHFWTEAVRIACYTQNRSILVKRHDKTPYEIFRERIPNIGYFHMFGCLVFIYNYKDHLGKFDAKADDGYFLGYSFVSKAFRVFNTRRQKVEETYHVTFDERMEAIMFTNTLVDEI
ncbi:retrovirus-related pol polyprotein from transposon TNT 1-94 [Tanacetum coccineum]